MAQRITRNTLTEGLAALAARDRGFARLYRDHGPPPMRARPAGFATLLKIICAQQVSTASARAIIGRLMHIADPLTPEAFLALDEAALRSIGFSRMKAAYGRGLAAAVQQGALDLAAIARLADDAAIAEIVKIRGLGRWSAEMYLLFALRRPDLWPVDDLAVVKGVQRLKNLDARPTRAEMLAYGEDWRPWRSVVARMMWHTSGNAPPDN